MNGVGEADRPSPADALAEAVAARAAAVGDTAGVAFGVPGGGPNLDVIGALARRGVRFVLAHGETAACIMASAHGYLTGTPSVAVVTRGPGASSAVNGAAQATLDRHPLIVVTDTVPTASAGRVPHQRLDQTSMLAPASKRSATLGTDPDPGRLLSLLDQAVTAPAGAVHLDYDASVQGLLEQQAWEKPDAKRPEGPTDDHGRAEAQALINSARRPIVIAGLGAVADAGRPGEQTEADLVAALEAFGAPVLTTYQAIGAIPTGHDQWAGLFTNGASERPLLDRCDLVVTIGLDMVEPIPAPWNHDVPIVSFSAHPTTDPYLPITVEILGHPITEAERFLAAPASRADHQWAPDTGRMQREQVRTDLVNGGALDRDLGPLEVVKTVAAAMPKNATTTVDAGAHFLAIMPFWPVRAPKRLLISNGLATMGYAVPAAIGAALARPGEPVVCLVGDGGLGMTMAELETIVRLELPITVVVFNDSELSLIKIKQQDGHGGDEVVGYRPTDFATVSAGFGLAAERVRSVDGLEGVLGAGWDGPRLIDAVINPSPYSHLMKVTRG